MRATIFIILIFCLFTSCKKDKYGSVAYKVRYNTSKSELKSSNSAKNSELRHTQFGNYITSVTPNSFIGNFGLIRFHADSIHEIPTFMTLLQGSEFDDPICFADFSNNATVTMNPTLAGYVNHDGSFSETITFVFLFINICNIYQVVELPVQYSNINLSQFNKQYWQNEYSSDSVKKGNVLTVDFYPLYKVIDQFENDIPFPSIYFGRTDTTSIHFSGSIQDFPELKALPLQVPFIWSHKYSEWTLTPAAAGSTRIVTCTVSFDNENLIQIYAGADDVPYTGDDFIVYSPNFWERISITVNIE